MTERREGPVLLRAAAIVATCAAAAIGGCATFPAADEATDREAKTFAVSPGRANIYLYREEGPGEAVVMDVLLDGVPMGRTGPRTYFVFDVEPGSHTLTSRAENESSVTLAVEAGANRFVRQEVRMGVWYARTRLAVVDEPTGRAGVAQCRLVPGTQEVEVRLESEGARPAGPLACEASNAFGVRRFTAPGTVTVFASGSPLRIGCGAKGGEGAAGFATVPGAGGPSGTVQDAATSGAALGAVAGIVAGAAVVPVAGPAFAILIAAGSVAKGHEIGSVAGALGGGQAVRYPSPIVVRIALDPRQP
jgi:hypothetical protein